MLPSHQLTTVSRMAEASQNAARIAATRSRKLHQSTARSKRAFHLVRVCLSNILFSSLLLAGLDPISEGLKFRPGVRTTPQPLPNSSMVSEADRSERVQWSLRRSAKHVSNCSWRTYGFGGGPPFNAELVSFLANCLLQSARIHVNWVPFFLPVKSSSSASRNSQGVAAHENPRHLRSVHYIASCG